MASSSSRPAITSRPPKANSVTEALKPNSQMLVEVYHRAMELMWNYDLDGARELLAPWRSSSCWHAGAYAECAALRVVLTGRRCEAASTLELVRIAEALCEGCPGSEHSIAHQVFLAELWLLRSGLQIMLGARLRAIYNLRQCWCAYRRLEHHLASLEKSTSFGSVDSTKTGQQHFQDCSGVFLADDVRGRIVFGLGFFYLATSLLPAGICALVRLAGFIMHRNQGKAYLSECAERDLGPRAVLAAILLAVYHLDSEPDVTRAGMLLVGSLCRQPENVLLHWAGSLLAWRNSCITQAVEMTDKALLCCGPELGSQAVYLRYELGMFRFIAMDWAEARMHLLYVYDAIRTERIFFPYKTVVASQIAAVSFSLGHDAEGEALCRECTVAPDLIGTLRLENDFVEVLQVFLERRVVSRQLLAFEVMYLLRQFPKVPAQMLMDIQEEIRQVAQPHVTKFKRLRPDSQIGVKAAAPKIPSVRPESEEMALLVEYVGAQVMQCVVLFYLGEVEQAMSFVPELSHLCACLPPWCTYLRVHGLYWCGRMLALSENSTEALRCLRQASKVSRKYPFNIGHKISKVLESLEREPPQK